LPVDRKAILENANLLASRGQLEKAIAEFKKLTVGPSPEATLQNTIGDLQLKRHAVDEAIEAYLAAANGFCAEGAGLKAIAIYKKIIKLDPLRFEAYERLADLNASRGLTSSAVSDYLILSKLYMKVGRIRDALEVFRTIAKLEPSNLTVRKRIAELCLQENLRRDAVEAYLQLAQAYADHKREAEARVSYETVLRLHPDNPAATLGLRRLAGIPDLPTPATPENPDQEQGPPRIRGLGAEILQARLEEAAKHISGGKYFQAEMSLTELLNSEPGNPDVCRLLAQLHLRRGELPTAKGEFQFLAEAAMRAHDYALARAMIGDYLNADPGCVPLLELLGRIYEMEGDTQSAVAQYGKALEILVDHPDPDAPTLPSELYAKIRSLAPGSPLILRLAAAFESPGAFSGRRPATRAEGAPRVGSDPGPGPGPSVNGAKTAGTPLESGPQPQVEEDGEQRSLSEEECATRFELGVALRDMGLFTEALDELRLAASGEPQFLQAGRVIAICLKEQGLTREAIKQLEQLLADPRAQGDRASPVIYDLGLLYEAEGREDSAQQMFARIPTFQDVPQRLERLRGGGHTTQPSHIIH